MAGQPWYYYAPFHDLVVGHPAPASIIPQHFLFGEGGATAKAARGVCGPLASMLIQSLARAVQRDDLVLLQRLLLLASKVDGSSNWFLNTVLNGVDAVGCTLLHRAVTLATTSNMVLRGLEGATEPSGEPYMDVLALLVQAGADVNGRDIRGATPLHYAAVSGNLPLTQILLRSGADPTLLMDDGTSPLLAALQAGAEDVARVLLGETRKALRQAGAGAGEAGGGAGRAQTQPRTGATARLFMQPPPPPGALGSLLFHAVAGGDLVLFVYLTALTSVPTATTRPHPAWWFAAAAGHGALTGVLLAATHATSRIAPPAMLSGGGLEAGAAEEHRRVAATARRPGGASPGPGGEAPWGLDDSVLEAAKHCMDEVVLPLLASPAQLVGGGDAAADAKAAPASPCRAVATSTTLFLLPPEGRHGGDAALEIGMDLILRLALGGGASKPRKAAAGRDPLPVQVRDAGLAPWDALDSGRLAPLMAWQASTRVLAAAPHPPGARPLPRTALAFALGGMLGATRRRGHGKRSAWEETGGAPPVAGLGSALHLPSSGWAGGDSVPPPTATVRLPALLDKPPSGKGGAGGTLTLHVSVGDPVTLVFPDPPLAAAWAAFLTAAAVQRKEAAHVRAAVARGGRWLHGATHTLRSHVAQQRRERRRWLRGLAGAAAGAACAAPPTAGAVSSDAPAAGRRPSAGGQAGGAQLAGMFAIEEGSSSEGEEGGPLQVLVPREGAPPSGRAGRRRQPPPPPPVKKTPPAPPPGRSARDSMLPVRQAATAPPDLPDLPDLPAGTGAASAPGAGKAAALPSLPSLPSLPMLPGGERGGQLPGGGGFAARGGMATRRGSYVPAGFGAQAAVRRPRGRKEETKAAPAPAPPAVTLATLRRLSVVSATNTAAAVAVQAAFRGWWCRRLLAKGQWTRVRDEDGDVYWWSGAGEVSSWWPPLSDPGFDYAALAWKARLPA